MHTHDDVCQTHEQTSMTGHVNAHSCLWTLATCRLVCRGFTVYIHTHHIFTHSSFNGYLCRFLILLIVNNAIMNVEARTSFCLSVLYPSDKYLPSNGVAAAFGCSILKFLRNIHIVFHSGCANLHSYQQWKGFTLFSISFAILHMCCLSDNSYLTGVM